MQTLETIDLSKLKLDHKIGNKIKIFYQTAPDQFEKLRFQTPKCRIPFDISHQKDKTGKPFIGKLSLSLDLLGTDKNKGKIVFFKNFMKEFDKILTTQGDKYYKCLYEKADYAPSVSVGFGLKNGVPQLKVYNKDSQEIPIDVLRRNCFCSFIIYPEHLWFASTGTCGVQWIAEQCVVYDENVKAPKQEIAFKDEDDD